MTASAPAKADDIETFLPGIASDEYDRRAKLRTYRNIAADLIARSDSFTARQLAWVVVDYAMPNLYSPAPLDWLDQINQLSKRLLLTALQAE